jgi:tRNA dimethylallyltransferase
MSSITLIAVCGPTASGKTALAVELALHVGGEIISVDSRQVYRGMDIGTGKDLAEYRTGGGTVPCHLIDIVDPEHIYTLWHFQRDFYRVYGEIRSRGRLPVASGGSGLYLEAVLRHYRIPNVSENRALREELMKESKEALVARLEQLGPGLVDRTDLSSKKRVVRAIEIALSGAVLPESEQSSLDEPRIIPLVIGVRWERAILRQRIRQRLIRRLEQGMVEEVRGLMQKGISPERLDLFGLEYRHVHRYLGGRTGYDAMVEALYVDICRFAKRQETYFRGMECRGTPITWIDGPDIEKARRFVDESRDRC